MHVSVHCMTMRMKSYSANVAWEKGMHVDFLMQIVLEEGLWIASRHMDSSLAHDSWTCCRCFDDAQVQIYSYLLTKSINLARHGAILRLALVWIIVVFIASCVCRFQNPHTTKKCSL